MKTYNYTEKEKALITKLYPVTRTKDLAKQLGVSAIALNAKAYKMGLVKKSKWLPREINFLKSNYSNMSAVQIANTLDRNFSSVTSMCEKLGLYFNKWSLAEVAWLKKIYEKEGSKGFNKKFPGKSNSTISAKARTLGLQKYHNFSRTVWTDAHITFLKNNVKKLSYGELAKKLHKTPSAVEHMASDLKLVGAISSSQLEEIIASFMTDNNISFKRQVALGRYHIDFVVADNIAIEVNGSYWHCDKRVFQRPTNKRQARALKSDKRKYKLLRSLGYRLIILWEKDINEDFSKITNGINAVISGNIDEYNSAKSVEVSLR